MTIYDFLLLKDAEQLSILYKEGVYIGKRKCENITIVLYQLEAFYIEIYYKKYRYNISRVECFSTTEQLNPYLHQIDLQDVIRCLN